MLELGRIGAGIVAVVLVLAGCGGGADDATGTGSASGPEASEDTAGAGGSDAAPQGEAICELLEDDEVLDAIGSGGEVEVRSNRDATCLWTRGGNAGEFGFVAVELVEPGAGAVEFDDFIARLERQGRELAEVDGVGERARRHDASTQSTVYVLVGGNVWSLSLAPADTADVVERTEALARLLAERL